MRARATTSQIGRALGDRLRRGTRATTADPVPEGVTPDVVVRPMSRAARLRRLRDTVRVTPYQVRRGWLW